MPPSGVDNYIYLKNVWEQEQMTSYQDFVSSYNNKDVVPTLDAMQKMIEFYQNKEIDMLKLGCKLSNLANICLHKSTNNKFYPFVDLDKNLHDKMRDVTGGPSTVFPRKAVVDQTFIRNSENICKSIVGKDASQITFFQCVKKCPLGFTLDGKLIQTLRCLKLGIINRGNLKTWLCRTDNLHILTALLKVTTHLELRKRLIVLM